MTLVGSFVDDVSCGLRETHPSTAFALKIFTGARILSDEELEVKRWDLEDGSGCGVSNAGRDENNFHTPKTLSEKSTCAATREYRVLRNLPSHPCVMPLLARVEMISQAVGLLFECAPHGDLFSVMKKMPEERFRSVRVLARFLFDIARALEHMHAHAWLHRDVKPDNVLIFSSSAWWLRRRTNYASKPSPVVMPGEDNVVARLGDLNWAASSKAARSCCVGTLDYLAPEMVRRSPHGASADIWSLGALAFEAHEGSTPFYETDESKTLDRIEHGTFRAFHAVPCRDDKTQEVTAFRNWVYSLMSPHPDRRPTAAEAVCFLRGVAWPSSS